MCSCIHLFLFEILKKGLVKTFIIVNFTSIPNFIEIYSKVFESGSNKQYLYRFIFSIGIVLSLKCSMNTGRRNIEHVCSFAFITNVIEHVKDFVSHDSS